MLEAFANGQWSKGPALVASASGVTPYNPYGFLMEVRRTSDNFLYWRADKVNAEGMLEVQEQGNNVLAEYFYNSQTLFLDSLRASNSYNFFNRWQFQFNSLGNLISKSEGDINKTENFEYDNLNRLIKSYVVSSDTVDVKYDELGNIIEKSDVGTYEYGGMNNGPHGVVKINQYNPQCIPSAQVKAEYTSFNKVKKISNDTATLEIFYGFDKQRNYANYYLRGHLTTTKVYISDLYEIESDGNNKKETHYIRGNAGVIDTYVVQNGKGKSYYWFKDHIGSLTTITDTLGNVIHRFNYDAWGKKRNLAESQFTDSMNITSQGFTGHEHYDLFDLVDMNGRIYDPVIGRFTSADPFIQDISDLQSLNRYSYVLNNPLSLTDPSGYSWFGDVVSDVGNAVGDVFGGIGSAIGSVGNAIGSAAGSATQWVKENWKTLVVVTVIIVASVATCDVGAAIGSAFWGAVISGAAAGFAGGFSATLLNGGNIGQALTSGAKGALIGGASAGLTYGVGSLASELGNSAQSSVVYGGVKVVGHGIVQGGVEEANGGQFLHGLYAGAVSGAYGTFSNDIDSKAIRLTGGAVIGGTTSEISGGKFVNGAVTGAYVLMFNDLLHPESESKKQYEAFKQAHSAIGLGGDILKEASTNGSGAYQYGFALGALGRAVEGASFAYEAIEDISEKNYGMAIFHSAVYAASWTTIGPYVAAGQIIYYVSPYIIPAANSFNQTSVEFKKATGDNFLSPGKY